MVSVDAVFYDAIAGYLGSWDNGSYLTSKTVVDKSTGMYCDPVGGCSFQPGSIKSIAPPPPLRGSPTLNLIYAVNYVLGRDGVSLTLWRGRCSCRLEPYPCPSQPPQPDGWGTLACQRKLQHPFPLNFLSLFESQTGEIRTTGALLQVPGIEEFSCSWKPITAALPVSVWAFECMSFSLPQFVDWLEDQERDSRWCLGR